MKKLVLILFFTLINQLLLKAYNYESVIRAIKSDDIDLLNEILFTPEIFQESQLNDALTYAIRVGNFEATKILLNSGADINFYTTKWNASPLMVAISNGHTKIVEYLLSKGANPNIKNHKNETTLMLAAKSDKLNIYKLLINKGIVINARDNSGNTAMLWAAEECSPIIISFLQDNGADIYDVDKYGNTTLHKSIKNRTSTIGFLMENGVDINKTNQEETLPLSYAVSKGNLKTIEYVVNKCSKLKIEPKITNNMILNAITDNRFEIFELLLDKSEIDINEVYDEYTSPLIAASSNVEMMDYILELGFDINSTGIRSKNALIYNVGRNNYNAVKFLLEKGADPNIIVDYKHNALNAAFGNKDLRITKILLDYDADPNMLYSNSYLFKSMIKNDNIELLKLLVENGLHLNTKFDDNTTLLHSAINSNSLQFVKYLIENGFDVSIFDDYKVDSPIIEAVKSHHFLHNDMSDVIAYLIKVGLDVNSRNYYFETPLMHAANNDLNLTKLLIENGADISAKNTSGFTALIRAVQGKKIEIVKYLIEQGADVNAKDSRGKSVLIHSLNNPDILELILKSGADINSVAAEGKTPLIAAIMDTNIKDNNQLDKINTLLQYGADINQITYESGSPLSFAITRKLRPIVNFLLETNADVDLKLQDNQTCLMIASEKGYTNYVNLLLEYNADPNLLADTDLSALTFAASKGHIDIIKTLIKHNAKLEPDLDCAPTALKTATMLGYLDIVKLLIENGAKIDYKDCKGRDAITIAKEFNQQVILEYLLSKKNQSPNKNTHNKTEEK
jgi:ankyrin repeat protein